MAKSGVNILKKNKGFTLIEVLVALAILSIALTTIIKVTVLNIKNTIYLQNKTIAAWVGTQVINEARIGLIKLSDDNEDHEVKMLNQEWKWQGEMVSTPNAHIKKIVVDVFDKASEARLIELESYVYVAKTE